uniref:RpoA-like protein n=1 Tax=Pelargonium spinosum TaxID=122196 RepID=A0A1Y0K5N6_9ROSI|nr:RpoA-like protein [Pelargonium spinosum]
MKKETKFIVKLSNPKNFAEWHNLEFAECPNGLLYGRFGVGPLRPEQSKLLMTTVRQTLLTDILCARVTGARIRNSSKHSRNIDGIQESIHEILHNLKTIQLKGDFEALAGQGPLVAILDVKGPQTAMAVDIELPCGIQVIDESHHIATITKPIDFYLELSIEIDSGESNRERPGTDEEGYSIDAIFRPIHQVDTSIYSYEYQGESFQTLFLEIWSDNIIEPFEALWKASFQILYLLTLVVKAKSVKSKEFEKGLHYGRFFLAPLTRAKCLWIETALRQVLVQEISGEWNRETPVSDEGGDSRDPIFTPIPKVEITIESSEDVPFQSLYIDIWTDGQIDPQQALWQASAKIMELVSIFLQIEPLTPDFFSRKTEEAWERQQKWSDWEEEPETALGLRNERESTRTKIIFLNEHFAHCLNRLRYQELMDKLIRDVFLEKLRNAFDKLKNIKTLAETKDQQQMLADSISEEIKASLDKETEEQALFRSRFSMRLTKQRLSFTEGEIGGLEEWFEKVLGLESFKKMPEPNVNKTLAEFHYGMTEVKERKDQIRREKRALEEELKKRRQERQRRQLNRSWNNGKDEIDPSVGDLF